MKTTILGILITAILALTACGVNKDAEVTAFVSEMDKMTNEITQKINSNATAAGVDEAQKVLDAKKSDLKARYNKLKELRGYELSEAVMKKLTDSISKNMEAVADLQIQNAEKTVSDQAFGNKMNKLYTDYTSIFGI